MPSGIGLQEILLIGVLVLLLFGPKGVSGIMRDLGRWVGKMKRYRDEFTRELMAMSEPVFTPEEIKQNERKRIRKQIKQSLRNLDSEQREKENREIRERLFAQPQYNTAKKVFCFVSLPEEVDTHPILKRLLADGKQVIVPFCIPKTREIGLAEIRDPERDLAPGTLNIPEPLPAGRIESIDPLSIDLFIIPGLAFDRECVRLGRGAGYFDRFLHDIKGHRPIWAVGFNCQMYPYLIPRETHDVNPDLIISPFSLIGPNHE